MDEMLQVVTRYLVPAQYQIVANVHVIGEIDRDSRNVYPMLR